MNKRLLGSHYEEKAVAFLLAKGYDIENRNYFTKYGELDIIISKDQVTAFVEVKYRSSDAFGQPYEAVQRQKRRRIMQSAILYITKHRLQNRVFRFDVVSILGDEIRHFENAFELDRRYSI